MNTNIIIILIVLLLVFSFFGLAIYFLIYNQNSSSPIKKILANSKIFNSDDSKYDPDDLAIELDSAQKKTSDLGKSQFSLDRKLRYAKWPISGFQFNFIKYFLTVAGVIVLRNHSTFAHLTVAMLVPFICDGLLNAKINKRYNLFDRDFPEFLMSFVSLLKSGMTAVAGLENAAAGLEDDSLVKFETETLVERLRMGLTEEQAIGSFGEDIPHPDIELFAQAMLLSRKVGGSLAGTIERLAKQVRRRSEFRKKAISAVALERNSGLMILGILVFTIVMITVRNPQFLAPAFKHPIGIKVFEAGVFCVVGGIIMSRKVTEIRV